MATDGPTPADCDPAIFANGVTIAILDGSSNAIERWVKALAKATKARIDWHFFGGRGNVLFLGNKRAAARIRAQLDRLEPGMYPGLDPYPNPALLERRL